MRTALPLSPPVELPEHDWALWLDAAPVVLRLGFRASVWWLAWLALVHHRTSLHHLSADQAEALMRRACRRSGFLERQLRQALKVVVGLAAHRAGATPARGEA